jgi:MFS family permease
MRQLTPGARLYVVAVILAGFGLTGITLALNAWSLTDVGDWEHLGELPVALFFLVFTLFASTAPVTTATGVTLSVNLAPMFAAALTLNPGLASLIGLLGSANQRLPGPGYPWHRYLFNRALLALMYGSAALTFHGIVASGGHDPINIASAALVALIVIAALNSPLVVLVVHLTTGASVRKVAYESLQGILVGYIGLAPIGAMAAFLVSSRKLTGVGIAASLAILLLIYRELTRRSYKLETVARGSYVAQSRLIDMKDRSTYGHSERVGLMSEEIANEIRLAPDLVEQVRIGATLHDLGKIAIPDAVLHKTGKLTSDDWDLLKTHAEEGYLVLREQEVLLKAAEIVRSHHENFDGSGYPLGIVGRAIPVGGRITRVVDSYDCMTNVRDYRAWIKQPFEALSEIHSLSGSWYDPAIVDAFTRVLVEQHPELGEAISGTPIEPKVGLRGLMGIPGFRKLWLATGLSNLGDMLTTTGLALAAYGVSRSVLAVGAVFAVRAVPDLLFGLAAGTLVDRYDRKALMILMDVVRMILIASIPLLLRSDFTLVLGVVFLSGVATAVFNPARQAAVPDLIPHNLLLAANSAFSLVERVTEIVGFAAAATIVVLLSRGISLLFALDALTFMLSAGLILSIAFPELVAEGAVGTSLRRIRHELAEGLRRIAQRPELRAIFPFSFFMVAAGSALLVLMVPLASDHFGGQSVFPLLEMSIAVGAAAGTLVTGLLETSRRWPMMVAGAVGMGIFTSFAGLTHSVPLAMVFFAIAGVANMVFLIPMVTAIQEITESEMRGRVFAARFTVIRLGYLVGIAYASLLTATIFPHAQVGFAVLTSGILMIAVSTVAALSPGLRKI